MKPAHLCPYCKAVTTWEGNPWRPFCSERCKMVDLGLWSMEQYRVAGKPAEEQGESSSTPGSDTSSEHSEREGEAPHGFAGRRGRR